MQRKICWDLDWNSNLMTVNHSWFESLTRTQKPWVSCWIYSLPLLPPHREGGISPWVSLTLAASPERGHIFPSYVQKEMHLLTYWYVHYSWKKYKDLFFSDGEWSYKVQDQSHWLGVFYMYMHFYFHSLHTHLNKHRKNQTCRWFSSFLIFFSPKVKGRIFNKRKCKPGKSKAMQLLKGVPPLEQRIGWIPKQKS